VYHTFCIIEIIVIIVIINLFDRFFLFLTLDKAVGPFLDKHFDMKLWHPMDEASLNKLIDAEIVL
jgi:hypothetical protein